MPPNKDIKIMTSVIIKHKYSKYIYWRKYKNWKIPHVEESSAQAFIPKIEQFTNIIFISTKWNDFEKPVLKKFCSTNDKL